MRVTAFVVFVFAVSAASGITGSAGVGIEYISSLFSGEDSDNLVLPSLSVIVNLDALWAVDFATGFLLYNPDIEPKQSDGSSNVYSNFQETFFHADLGIRRNMGSAYAAVGAFTDVRQQRWLKQVIVEISPYQSDTSLVRINETLNSTGPWCKAGYISEFDNVILDFHAGFRWAEFNNLLILAGVGIRFNSHN